MMAPRLSRPGGSSSELTRINQRFIANPVAYGGYMKIVGKNSERVKDVLFILALVVALTLTWALVVGSFIKEMLKI